MENFKSLFQRYLDNNLSAKEMAQLHEMLASERYEEIAQEVLEEYDFNKSVNEISDDEYQRVEGYASENVVYADVSRKVRFYRLGIAASLVALAALISIGAIVAVYMHKSVVVTDSGTIRKAKELIKLPDGSEVFLNNLAQVTYKFTDESREIYLTGEAYCNVTEDPGHPFLVHAGGILATVVGTAFNVDAAEESKEVIITVERGKVKVSKEFVSGPEYMLTPNQQLSINKETNEVHLNEAVDIGSVLEWKDGTHYLSFEEVSRKIEEHFKVRVMIENPHIKNCLIKGLSIENKKLEGVLRDLCQITNAEYKISGRNVTIKGGKCN